MRIWIDTEFNEFGGELISMALIAEDGSEFYEVLPCPSPRNWVAANVMPILGQAPIDKKLFQQRLQKFLMQWDRVHVIADWPDDLKFFNEALITGPGFALQTPPMVTMELARWINGKSQLPHNAKADAKANMIAYMEFMKKLAGEAA